MGLLFERAISARRPLSRATASLRPSAASRGRHGVDFLAELLDFKGAVDLSRVLGAKPPSADADATEGLAGARRRLERAEREARRPLDDRGGDAALLSGARVDALMQKVFAKPLRRNVIQQAARELYAPVEARLRDRVGLVRRLTREARDEIGPTIAARGAASARLEQLDAALTAATGPRIEALFERAVAALGDAFASELERALLELPRPARGEPVEPWSGASRFAAEHVARAEAFIVATYQHECLRLDMLAASGLGEAT